jgi:hydrogenase expression/formation protein HypE
VEEGRALEGLLLSSGHDPTEGGVAMGIHEICRRSGTGAMVVFDALPIRDETRRLCARFAMDPLGLLSSGVFLFTAPRGVAEEACRLLLARQIPASIIGEIREQGEGVTIQRESKREALPFSVQDEIVKLRRPTARPSSPRPSTR